MRLSRLALCTLLMATAAAPAFADQSPALDRFNLSIGVFRGDTHTDLAGGSKNVSPAVRERLSFENDLGFPEHNTIYRLRADGLFTDHNGWAVDYYRLNRSRSTGYAATYPAADGDVDVSAQAKGRMTLQLGTAAYQHWFGSQADVFGLGVGAAYYHVNLRLSATGSASQNGEVVTDSGAVSYREGAWAPLVTVGYRHAFNDQWRLYANASGIKKNGGPLSGHIYNGALGLTYYPWQQVGFGVEYSVSKIHLNRDGSNYQADLNIKTTGPGVYVHWRF